MKTAANIRKVSIGFSVQFSIFSCIFYSCVYIQYICNFCGLRNCISALSMLRLRFQAQYLNNSISILNITSKYAFPYHFKGIAVETYIFAISKWQDMHTANMTVWSALKHHYAQPKIPFKWFSSICWNTLVIFNMRWISISCTWAKSRHPSKTSREFILFGKFPFLLNWNKSSCMTYSSVKRTKKNTRHCRTTSSTKFKSFTFLLSLQSFPVIMIFSTKNLILQILISGQKLLPAQNWFPHKYIMNLLAINFHILRPK